MIVLGFDPGAGGAYALIHPDGRIEVRDMPVHSVRRGKRLASMVDATELARELRTDLLYAGEAHAYVEQVGAMPGQGVSSMFAFGRSAGVIDGVLAALMVPVTYVAPSVWQRGVGLSKEGKDAGRKRASELFPQYAGLWARYKDHGRADAVLLAHFGTLQNDLASRQFSFDWRQPDETHS